MPSLFARSWGLHTPFPIAIVCPPLSLLLIETVGSLFYARNLSQSEEGVNGKAEEGETKGWKNGYEKSIKLWLERQNEKRKKGLPTHTLLYPR